MNSINRKLYFFLLILLNSCNQTKDKNDECLADVPPYLSSIVEESQMKNLSLIIADLSIQEDKVFFSDFYDILILFSDHLSNLVEKNGGVRINEFTLVNSCEMPSDQILKSHQIFLNSLSTRKNNFKERYENSTKYKEILRFLDYTLNNYLFNKNAILSLNNIRSQKMGIVIIRLLLIQSSLSSYEMEVVLPKKLNG
jgi:hypothetical protein